MKLVLDTNAVSALMKGDSGIVERLKQRSKGEVSVPQPVLAEIAYGIERLPKSKRKEALQEHDDDLVQPIQLIWKSFGQRLRRFPRLGRNQRSPTQRASLRLRLTRSGCW